MEELTDDILYPNGKSEEIDIPSSALSKTVRIQEDPEHSQKPNSDSVLFFKKIISSHNKKSAARSLYVSQGIRLHQESADREYETLKSIETGVLSSKEKHDILFRWIQEARMLKEMGARLQHSESSFDYW
jgi:hypothetical protein